MTNQATPARVEWVDIAKGLCIILVVMLHSTSGVEVALGEESWMGEIVAFAQPFRIPAFFFVAGLFLASRIDRDWRAYADAKVMHFVYFYVLWVTIQFAFKAPGFITENGVLSVMQLYLMSFVQPFGTLWFIYLLPVFFVFTKFVRSAAPSIVIAFGVALELLPVHTGSIIIDEFCSRFIYFYCGYMFAKYAFRIAEEAVRRPEIAGAGLLLWAGATFFLVQADAAGWPIVSLILGAAGTAALVSISALLSKTVVGSVLTYVGSRSLVVYLAFFLPMAVTRIALIKLGIVPDVGLVAAIVLIAAVTGPLILDYLIQRVGFGHFLFVRPGWARLPKGIAPKPPQRPFKSRRDQGEDVAVAMLASRGPKKPGEGRGIIPAE